MELFQDEQAARLAGVGIAPLLEQNVEQVRGVTATTLLKLHDRSGVLKELVKLEKAGIRAEAEKLLAQWKVQQLSRIPAP